MFVVLLSEWNEFGCPHCGWLGEPHGETLVGYRGAFVQIRCGQCEEVYVVVEDEDSFPASNCEMVALKLQLKDYPYTVPHPKNPAHADLPDGAILYRYGKNHPDFQGEKYLLVPEREVNGIPVYAPSTSVIEQIKARLVVQADS